MRGVEDTEKLCTHISEEKVCVIFRQTWKHLKEWRKGCAGGDPEQVICANAE